MSNFYDGENNLTEVDVSGLTTAEILPKESIILAVQVSTPAFQRKLKDNEKEKVLMKDKDTEYLSSSKSLIAKKYLSPLQANGSRLRDHLKQIGFRPSFLADGSVIVPKGALAYAIGLIEKSKEDRAKLVENLAEVWEQAKLEAQTSNPDLYDPSQYPGAAELPDKFAISYTLLAVGMPDVSEYLDSDTVIAHQAEYTKQMDAALDECKQALRSGFSELVDGMCDKLSGMGTERKAFRSGFVDKFRVYLDVFDSRNLANDTELAELVNRARSVLNGISPDRLRNDIEMKTRIESELVAVKQQLDVWLEPVRREFSF